MCTVGLSGFAPGWWLRCRNCESQELNCDVIPEVTYAPCKARAINCSHNAKTHQ